MYLSDDEKRILFSALSREKTVCQELDNKDEEDNRKKLVPIVESLERKFYYDRFEKYIVNKTIDTILDKLRESQLSVEYSGDTISCVTLDDIERITKESRLS